MNASVTPSTLTGGTFSWSATGPKQQVSASSTGPSDTVRWTDTGTYQAKVSYTRNGFTATSFVNVNVVLPVLDSFTAIQEPSLVSDGCVQSSFGLRSQYTLGCVDFDAIGITFSSAVHLPPGQYLSDPSQAGVKYIQRVSAFRKRINDGVTQCRTSRTSEVDNNSGWLYDGADVDAYDPQPTARRRFSEGTSLTIETEDSPGQGLEGPEIIPPAQLPLGLNDNHQLDAVKVDDVFEMFVVYFTSNSAPLQRTLGKLPWNWGGIVVYDIRGPNSAYYPHRLTSMFGGTGQRTGAASSQAITYQGSVSGLSFGVCPGAPNPPPPLNLIDNSRFFVRQQYKDILNRAPDAAWLVWMSIITECDFNQICLNSRRISVVRGFFESAEFRQTHPGLENPGSPQYNEAYVKQLYYTLLRRPPDAAWTAWRDYINQTGNYDGLVGGFINSAEYRNRNWQ